MSSQQKKYSVSNIKRLIDLNGDMVNFEIDYKVKSLSSTPFDMIIVDQKDLDASNSLEYKRVDTEISGKVISNNNEYHSYLIVIKSDSPTEVLVEIIKKSVEPQLQQPPSEQQNPSQSFQSNASLEESPTNRKIFLFIGGATVVCILLYLYFTNVFSRKEKSKEEDHILPALSPPAQQSVVLSAPVSQSAATPVIINSAPITQPISVPLADVKRTLDLEHNMYNMHVHNRRRHRSPSTVTSSSSSSVASSLSHHKNNINRSVASSNISIERLEKK